MKGALIAAITALSLAVGAGAAQAYSPGDWGQWGDGGAGQSSSAVVAVAGVVTSVDQSGSSFQAEAFVPPGQDWGQAAQGDQNGTQGGSDESGWSQGDMRREWRDGDQMASTPVTITTDGATTFRVDGQGGTLGDLASGDRFVALFNGSPGSSLQTLVSGPAVAVFAHTPPAQHQLYAFVGTVTGVDATAGTVTVQVSNSVPSGLVSAASNPATFTVSPGTMVLGGTSTNGLFGGSLNDVSAGDTVAGGLIGPAGETLSQVESSPLQVLVDFPTTATPAKSSAFRKAARTHALAQALTLFGYKTKTRTTGKGHKARRGNTHAHHGRRGPSRPRSHARRL